jgi:hypothetical protein
MDRTIPHPKLIHGQIHRQSRDACQLPRVRFEALHPALGQLDAKKTQRAKDWPVIEELVSIHCRENHSQPTAEWIDFWPKEARSAKPWHKEVRTMMRTAHG